MTEFAGMESVALRHAISATHQSLAGRRNGSPDSPFPDSNRRRCCSQTQTWRRRRYPCFRSEQYDFQGGTPTFFANSILQTTCSIPFISQKENKRTIFQLIICFSDSESLRLWHQNGYFQSVTIVTAVPVKKFSPCPKWFVRNI